MAIDFDEEIRNMVCEAMSQHSVTPTDLAGRTGLSLAYLSRVLRGNQTCSTKRWSQLMNAVVGEQDSQPVAKTKPKQPKTIENKAETPAIKPGLVVPLVPPKPPASVYGEPRVITAEEFDRL